MDALPSRIYGLSESARPIAAVELLGQLHLIAEAYRRQQSLAPELLADARREVGLTQSREALLSDEETLTVTGTWRVIGPLMAVALTGRDIEQWAASKDIALVRGT